MAGSQEKPPKSRKFGCGLGCGITALVLIILVALAVYHFGRPVREAKRTEQLLNDRFAEAVVFTPAFDGSVSPERIEAFLRVRQAVHADCAGLQDILENVINLEELDEETEASGSAKLVRAVTGIKGLLKLGPRFLSYVNARNTALLEEQMGLGEYIYIYVLAYHAQLVQIAQSRYGHLEEAHVSERTRRELAQILRNQLGALETNGDATELAVMATQLRAQILALEEAKQEVPWQDGLPEASAASFAPFADRLDRFHCDGIVKFELLQKNKGLQFEG